MEKRDFEKEKEKLWKVFDKASCKAEQFESWEDPKSAVAGLTAMTAMGSLMTAIVAIEREQREAEGCRHMKLEGKA